MSSPITRKILVVEDDDATRRGLVALLRNAGYEVVSVNSIPDAKKALMTERPHLLITDIRLLAGPERASVAGHESEPDPAIVLTGFPDPVLEAEAQHLGADFMLKPATPSELMAIIERKFSDSKTSKLFIPADDGNGNISLLNCRRRSILPWSEILDVSYGGVRFAADKRSARHHAQVDVPNQHPER